MMDPEITEQDAKDICDCIRRGNCRDSAFAVAGRGKWVYRNWVRRGEQDRKKGLDTIAARFALEIRKAEQEVEERMVRSITECATEDFVKCDGAKGTEYERKDWKAAAWFLERVGPKNWQIKKTVTLEIEDSRRQLLEVAETALEPWKGAYAALIEALATKDLTAAGGGEAEGTEEPEE